LCRSHIAIGSDLGKKIADIVNNGQLIPDAWVAEMVLDWFGKTWTEANSLFLDGFPRTVGQASAFCAFLDKKALKNNFLVILLEISDNLIIERLANRVVCSNADCQAVYSLSARPPKVAGICDLCESTIVRRKDDAPDSIKERLVVYNRYKDGMVHFYKQTGCAIKTLSVEGDSLDTVCTNFKKMVWGC
jgi:adenylate kinase